MTKYVFTMGGVVSSLGKGIASATLGGLLRARGYKVRLRKMDPYLNMDPGALNPYQHGETFITQDGACTDLDLGHYERFAGINCHKTDSVSGGRIYYNVLSREQRGEYRGATVQMIPHVSNELKLFMDNDLMDEDFVLYEVGGTVGDIEGTLFLEAVRQFMNEKGRQNCCVVYLTLLPFIETAGELKTKPTQQAVKKLLEAGIQANVLLCRSKMPLGPEERKKLALFCNVAPDNVISALDVRNIYELPLSYHEQGLDTCVLNYFGIHSNIDLSPWERIVATMKNFKYRTKIAVVGKYCHLEDAYKSLKEALTHAGIHQEAKIDIDWLDATDLEPLSESDLDAKLAPYHGLLVPGGWGPEGIEGLLKAIRYAREKKTPYLGICLGFELAVIEAIRHLYGETNANSTEFTPDCVPVIDRMMITQKDGIQMVEPDVNGTHSQKRLGNFTCHLTPDSLVARLYGTTTVAERHHNRYEMNNAFVPVLEEKGLKITGTCQDGLLPEFLEMPDHPFYVATMAHPEFSSKPFAPHPLFVGFVQACLKKAGMLNHP